MRECLIYIQQIRETLALYVWSHFIFYRKILGTLYIQLKNYPAIIYWLTKSMNRWDYHCCSPFSFNFLIIFLLFSVVQLLTIINSIITLCPSCCFFHLTWLLLRSCSSKIIFSKLYITSVRHQTGHEVTESWTRILGLSYISCLGHSLSRLSLNSFFCQGCAAPCSFAQLLKPVLSFSACTLQCSTI